MNTGARAIRSNDVIGNSAAFHNESATANADTAATMLSCATAAIKNVISDFSPRVHSYFCTGSIICQNNATAYSGIYVIIDFAIEINGSRRLDIDNTVPARIIMKRGRGANFSIVWGFFRSALEGYDTISRITAIYFAIDVAISFTYARNNPVGRSHLANYR